VKADVLLRDAVLLIVAALAGTACGKSAPPAPAIESSFTDDFERDDLGADWLATSHDAYHLSNGSVQAKGGYNHPLWLRRRLPDAAVIELDAWSQSPGGDIKVEIYGDGKSFDPDKGGYLSTGYVLVMGGWNNSKSIIARLDEHGKDVSERSAPRVEIGRRYHWRIVRDGGLLRWYVDDMSTPFLELRDPEPLAGADHGFFAFNDWESDVGFDNLVIRKK